MRKHNILYFHFHFFFLVKNLYSDSFGSCVSFLREIVKGEHCDVIISTCITVERWNKKVIPKSCVPVCLFIQQSVKQFSGFLHYFFCYSNFTIFSMKKLQRNWINPHKEKTKNIRNVGRCFHIYRFQCINNSRVYACPRDMYIS